MNPKALYTEIFESEASGERTPKAARDPLHRLILDPIFDPFANPRPEVALSLLEGGERLLDLGCWHGAFLARVESVERYRQLVGVDFVAEGIDAARARGFDAHAVDLNTEPLPFPDAHFDGVVHLAVLEHVFDPYAVIREVHRVLKPGGEFVIAVPNVASLTNRLRILFGRIPVTSSDAGWDGGHLHYFSKHALDHFLADEGFEVLERRTSGGRAALREWWISLLAGELIYRCRRT
ncbi:MAG: methyltransferase domain-containing protein [Deltaproteobacteria bacterium]|nr:methyltransferase domain-containing protein [Deltaproteobacteria bacterium]MBW2398931.1 methyltransferase domain-containing protein [Deltaproteobacteria bacterium]MBW2665131.1 methyltransferase domain-containing protein [Deltaproteobacteria bacterium]